MFGDASSNKDGDNINLIVFKQIVHVFCIYAHSKKLTRNAEQYDKESKFRKSPSEVIYVFHMSSVFFLDAEK